MTKRINEHRVQSFPHNKQRRQLLLIFFSCALLAVTRKFIYAKELIIDRKPRDKRTSNISETTKNKPANRINLGASANGSSDVFISKGSPPEQNIHKIIEMLGGISSIISKDDIVVLKPNAQWWNQGTTNTDAMRAFIQAVLNIPGFRGEVIIAENHQYAAPNSRGWNTEKRNGRFNLNELVAHFNSKGHSNVTKYHWRCAGPNPKPLQGDESYGSKIVTGPWQGDGYVWNQDLFYTSPLGRKCILSYPIFTSSYSGVTIDFKNGAWKNNKYIGQPVKFINFSALNHHSAYCGVTASVKNYMGIVDMTCGFQGTTPNGYWNTHYIGIRNDLKIPMIKYMPWRVRVKIDNLYKTRFFHHTGNVIGSFMREVRMADLNIITANWVGYESRTDTSKSGHPKAILASRDPVALDFIAGREVLSPLTREKEPDNRWLNKINDVTDKNGPFHKFLAACHQEGIGNIEPKRINVMAAPVFLDTKMR